MEGRGRFTQARMVVGEDGTGEESPAVGVRPEPGVTEVDGTVEPVQLLSGAAQPGEGEMSDMSRYSQYFHLLATSGCSQSPVCSSKTRWF